MENVFSINKQLCFYNCDRDKNLLLSSYLGWCGEIAGMQLDARGITREDMLDARQVFLLNRHACKQLRPAKYRQSCVLKTWEMAIQGPRFIRGYALEDMEGTRLWESVSSWVLVDPVSRKILRPADYNHKSLFSDESISVELPKFRLPEAPETAVHTVPFSQIDGNGHLSNRFYGDMLSDYAPAPFVGRPITEADITFSHEARLGEQIHIHTAATDENAYFMYGLFEDGRRCFEALAKVAEEAR